MNAIIFRIGLVAVLLGSLPVFAQRHETFAQRPAKRQERVKSARERATREKEEARQWAQARGLKMRHDDGHNLMELMAIRNGRPVYYITHNANAAISTAANRVRDTVPYNINGSGITVGVWDGGSVRSDHQEFGGRVTVKDGASTHYHATHVGGTIGASGVQANAKGMASGTHIDSYDWDFDEAEIAAVAAAEPNKPNTIKISNHSYGYSAGWSGNYWLGKYWNVSAQDATFGQYSSYTEDWDDLIHAAPYFLPFVSAGNERTDGPPANGSTFYVFSVGKWISVTYDSLLHPKGDGVYKGGYDTITDKALAKNVMTVGAVNDAVSIGSRYLPWATYTTFTSWGPADDGRIKPDIVANGRLLYSCDDDHTADYASKSGTSMSSPNACGSAALLVDYYDDLFPGGAMRASTLKGLIIHTADDLGRPGPDYSYGWGLMNTLAAAELLRDFSENNAMRLQEEKLSTSNASDTYTILSGGDKPLRVTLCWTDPAYPVGDGELVDDNRVANLVNDLDLKITGPGGTYYPYKLSYLNPSANATTNSKNNVDNVEQVYIAVPAAGLYTITIDHDGALDGDEQHYSLLVSGIANDSDDDGLPDYWELAYFQNPTGAVASADSDGDGSDNLSEYITGYNPTNSSSVFRVTFSSIPETGSTPTIITWNSVVGRTYDMSWSSGLIYPPFEFLGTNMPYTQNSYTDWVERATLQNFYRIDTRLGQ